MPARQLFLELGRILLLHASDQVLGFTHLPLDLFAVVPVIGKGCMDIRQGQLGEVRGDVIGCLALKLVPDLDVVNPNASADDARFSAANAGSALNMFNECRFHALIVREGRIADNASCSTNRFCSPGSRGDELQRPTRCKDRRCRIMVENTGDEKKPIYTEQRGVVHIHAQCSGP